MNKLFISMLISGMIAANAYAASTVFDSMEKAKEVKLQPAASTTTVTTDTKSTASTSKSQTTIKKQKYNNMLVDLDDAQVELRQELSVKTTEYTTALNEKQIAISNCKALKKQVNALKKEMKNVEKSKTMINKNLRQTSAS